MNIYLVDKQTGQFYAGDERWVAEQGGAYRFPSTFDAIQHAMRTGRTADLEFVYAFPDPHSNFTVPFNPRN